MDARRRRARRRMRRQAALTANESLNVAAMTTDAPARCPFLCYFLLGTQKKVDPKKIKRTYTQNQRDNLLTLKILRDFKGVFNVID